MEAWRFPTMLKTQEISNTKGSKEGESSHLLFHISSPTDQTADSDMSPRPNAPQPQLGALLEAAHEQIQMKWF